MGIGFAGAADMQKTPGTVVVPGVFHPHSFPVAAPQKRPRLFLSKHTRKKSISHIAAEENFCYNNKCYTFTLRFPPPGAGPL